MKLKNRSLYLQARDAILDIINNNSEFMNRLPSEQELSETLGVSRNTIREALKSLENEGFLVSRHGVGTFIIYDRKNIKSNISVLESTTNIIINHGYTPGTKSVHFEKKKTPSAIAKKLNISEDTDILYIERVRTANNISVIYVEDYIPYIDGMLEKYEESSCESLLDFLNTFGHSVAFSNCTISAVISDKDLQKKLSLRSPEALLCLQQIHYSSKGVPMLYSDSYFVSDKFEFNAIRKFID